MWLDIVWHVDEARREEDCMAPARAEFHVGPVSTRAVIATPQSLPAAQNGTVRARRDRNVRDGGDRRRTRQFQLRSARRAWLAGKQRDLSADVPKESAHLSSGQGF